MAVSLPCGKTFHSVKGLGMADPRGNTPSRERAVRWARCGAVLTAEADAHWQKRFNEWFKQ